MVDVIIPAGGKLPGSLVRLSGVERKPLLKITDRTILETTFEAIRGCDFVRRVVIVGPDEVLRHEACAKADDRIPEGKTGPENIFRALDWLLKQPDPPEYVMIVTADLPFITTESLRAFVNICPPGKDFCVPLISKDEFEEMFPSATATFVGLRDGTWTAGCAYLATTEGLKKAIHHIELVFKQRKSKLGMAKLLGYKFVWDLLFHKLTVSDVEAKVRELLQCEGVAVPGSPAELAYDVDDTEDYYYGLTYTKTLLSKRRSKSTP